MHPSTLYPGGVGTVATIQLMTDYMTRLMRYVEFMKKVVPMHDDLFDFFYEALPGYEKVGLRRTLLGCWGSLPGSRGVQLRLQGHGALGQRDVRHPGRGGRRQAGHPLAGRHQPRHPNPFGQFVLRRLDRSGDVRQDRSAGQSGGPPPSVEPAHQPAPAEAGHGRQVQLGDVAALVRRQGPPRAGHRRRPAGPAVGDGAGRPGRHRLRQGDRAQRADQPAQDRAEGPGRVGVEDPQARQQHASNATGPAPTSRPTRRRRTAFRREGAGRRSAPAAPRPGRSSRCPTRPSAAASPRRCAAC